MRYTRARIAAIGYELAPVVVTTAELEERVRPLYDRLHIPPGQVEAMTGIAERRWWEPGFRVSQGSIAATKKALAKAGVHGRELDALLYAGVCRDEFEPATACHVAAEIGVAPGAVVHDLSNACLGVVSGIIDLANRIELGQIRAGIVTSCETAREINEEMIGRMLAEPTIDLFKYGLTTLTGGSGAAAVLVTDGTVGNTEGHRLLGGALRTDPRFHELCTWGMEGAPREQRQVMRTDSAAVLKHGVELGVATWQALLNELGWTAGQVDKVICHQVGSGHRDQILPLLGLRAEQDFATYPFLGNIGTVSLPLTAAMAAERGHLRPGDRVGMLGIGSGLNCLMLGAEW